MIRTPIFLATGSRVATLVARHWHGPRHTVARRGRPDLLWNMTGPPPRSAPDWSGASLISFAGVTPGPGADLERNTALGLAALDAGQAWRARHVFICSSSAVYGDPGRDAVEELADPRPLAPYGAAKLDMERQVLAAAERAGISCTVLRLANVAGAGQPFDAARNPLPASLPLHRFDDGAGPSRSFIGPVSLARALAGLCRHVERGTSLPKILNVAAPGAAAMADILDGLQRRWHWVPAPVGAIPRVHLDTSRLARLCELPADAGTPTALIAELNPELPANDPAKTRV